MHAKMNIMSGIGKEDSSIESHSSVPSSKFGLHTSKWGTAKYGWWCGTNILRVTKLCNKNNGLLCVSGAIFQNNKKGLCKKDLEKSVYIWKAYHGNSLFNIFVEASCYSATMSTFNIGKPT